MSNQLTAEQQRRIEENRQKALERRAQRLGQTLSGSKQASVGFISTSLPVQPPKQSVNLEKANSASAPTRFVQPSKQESQRPYNTGNQIKQSTNPESSKEVRFNAVTFSHLETKCTVVCYNLFCFFLCSHKSLTRFLRQGVHM